MREGRGGQRTGSQSLGLSLKEGYTLSSSSGLDPPSPGQCLTSSPQGFPGPIKPAAQAQCTSGKETSICTRPIPWGDLLLTYDRVPQMQFQDFPQATHTVPRLDFTERALNVHAGCYPTGHTSTSPSSSASTSRHSTCLQKSMEACGSSS